MVSVTLIDDDTTETTPTFDLPIDNLPDTFEIETTLHLRDDDWSIVQADPQSMPDFTRSGTQPALEFGSQETGR
jgi:hypothetical protein